ncbi:MAG: adenine-specific methyltransferase EcoRI family protein [Oxalobacter formigenes]|nr:adenine-specific methyltransferase EcoRI family protein [Oxalobacter formigenes]
MKRNVNHSLLKEAKVNKKDEFYTQLCDIERELQHYKNHFHGKTVFCNCDDVTKSNFYNYFIKNFEKLRLKKIICACHKKNEADLFSANKKTNGFYYEYTGLENTTPSLNEVTFFNNSGDFRSEESIKFLKEADIVVTNPPFSLFREFVSQLTRFNKKFLIIGNINAITYKEIFKLIKENKVWLGVNLGRGISGFIVPQDYDLYGLETKTDSSGNKIISPNNCLWLTNLDISKKHKNIPLTKKYIGNEDYYPRYDNYDGINVNRTLDIPMDYQGVIGVPITFLHKFNPEQFEVIKFRKGNDEKDLRINGKPTYFRILVRNKQFNRNNPSA